RLGKKLAWRNDRPDVAWTGRNSCVKSTAHRDGGAGRPYPVSDGREPYERKDNLMSSNGLNRWLKPFSASFQGARRGRRARPAFRPGGEALEHRLVLSTVSW